MRGVGEGRLRRDAGQQHRVQFLAKGEALRRDAGSGQVVLADVPLHDQRAVLAVELGLHVGVEAVLAIFVDVHGLHVQGADVDAVAEQQPAAQPDLVAVDDEGAHVEATLPGRARQAPAALGLLEPQVAVGDGQAPGDEAVAAQAL